jgi:hypothetical protein
MVRQERTWTGAAVIALTFLTLFVLLPAGFVYVLVKAARLAWGS